MKKSVVKISSNNKQSCSHIMKCVRKRVALLSLIIVLQPVQPIKYIQAKQSTVENMVEASQINMQEAHFQNVAEIPLRNMLAAPLLNTTADPLPDTTTDPSTDTNTDPTDPSADPTDPSTDPTDPSTDPTDPSTDPTDPSTDPDDPSQDEDPTDTVTYEEVKETVYFKKAYTIYSEPDTDSEQVGNGVRYKKYTRVGIGSNEWDQLSIDDEVVYVKANYITKQKPTIPKGIVNKDDSLYSYTDMQKDLQLLSKYYPDYVSVSSIGTTIDKREIYCAVLGNPNASKQIIVQGSMHAREYINSQLLMMELEYYLSGYEKGSYKNVKFSELFSNISIHIIPMVNPDGVTLSQYGLKGIKSSTLVNRLKTIRRGASYTLWKANARGVDLNRNYPFGWTKKSDGKTYGAMNFPGPSSTSELETDAMIAYTKSMPNLKAAISYHSMGSIIYWNYGQKGKLLLKCIGLVSIAKSFTNYRLMPLSNLPSLGGYSDWVVMTLGIPAITIETGSTIAPVKHWQLLGIYSKNRDIIAATATKYQ